MNFVRAIATRKLLAVSASLALLGACAAEEDLSVDDALVRGPINRTPPRLVGPQVGACFYGRSFDADPLSAGGNDDVDYLAERLVGMLPRRDLRGKTINRCFAWNDDMSAVAKRLINVVDADRDGRISATESKTQVTLLGFSWGGFNARDVAKLLGDRGIRVRRLFLLDPFKVDVVVPKSEIEVPANVDWAWNFVHSVAPANDCSRAIVWGVTVLGPFTGRQMRCQGSTSCVQYDFSKGYGLRYPDSDPSQIRWATRQTDHCQVPYDAYNYVSELYTGAWPTVAVSGRTPPVTYTYAK